MDIYCLHSLETQAVDHLLNLLLDHCLRRLPNIKTAWGDRGQRFVFAGSLLPDLTNDNMTVM